jgi:sugar/nucleoside kinase (ribokinase family)
MTGNEAKGRQKMAAGSAEQRNSDAGIASPPQFVSIGHFTHDVTEHGLILGGPAAYSSIAAGGLGLRVGVVSAVGEDFLHHGRFDGIPIAFVGAPRGKPPQGGSTTTFTNIYEDGVRRQVVKNVSALICPEHIPSEWLGAEIVYLCPVANEIHPDVVRLFPDSLIGVSPQGWMRQWDGRGQVSPCKWADASKVLPHVDVVVMSEEDIAPFPEIVNEYIELADMVVLTKGRRGSTLFRDGQQLDFPAFSANTVDPTGAGDVFATAFLSKFNQTHDIHKASIFANCTASFVVEKEGTQGIPELARVRSRLTSGSILERE